MINLFTVSIEKQSRKCFDLRFLMLNETAKVVLIPSPHYYTAIYLVLKIKDDKK